MQHLVLQTRSELIWRQFGSGRYYAAFMVRSSDSCSFYNQISLWGKESYVVTKQASVAKTALIILE